MIFYKDGNKTHGWFRIFGYGVSWKDYINHGLTFSERLGKRKGIKIGSYIFHPLYR